MHDMAVIFKAMGTFIGAVLLTVAICEIVLMICPQDIEGGKYVPPKERRFWKRLSGRNKSGKK